MPNYGTYAICPYWQSEDPLRIKCEGIIKLNRAHTEFVLRFPTKGNKKAWMAEYCESFQYCSCPYASIIEAQIEDQGIKIR